MMSIRQQAFGRTGHASARLIFGSWALRQATTAEADRVLGLLLDYGVNHIDTAPMYGEAEKRVGRWMEKHRDTFFIASKTRKRTYREAWVSPQQSLQRLQVDCLDLWQIHGLTNPAGWERVMGPGGAWEALVEAREKGLVRFLGVTGHGIHTPAMHLRSLERFDFDSVMLPYNYLLMQNPRYHAAFQNLAARCRERGVALQAIKVIAGRTAWRREPRWKQAYGKGLSAMRKRSWREE
jgi:aryl-alcohol dehydrogenase-like predicted oxidoreductase